MKVRLLSALAALILAIVGAILIFAYVQGADRRALAGTETAEVYVVTTPAPAGTRAEDLGGFVSLRLVPKSVVVEGAVTDLADFSGRVAAVDLMLGEQLIESRLVDPSALGVPGTVPVPEGMQEFTVQLSADRVVGGRLNAGDTVGVFVSFDSGAEATGGPTTHLLFHKMLVTSVQGIDAPAEEGTAVPPPVPGGAVLVTIAANAPDAEKIVFAAEFGTLWLSKESEGASEEGTGVVTREGVY